MKKLALPAAGAAAIAATVAFAIPASSATSVRVDDDVFKPGSVSVSKGATVKWKFVGDDPHNVTVKKGPAKFHSGTKSSGSFSKKLKKRGTYRIVCTVHSGMKMTLKVK